MISGVSADWIEQMTPELWAKRAAMREEIAAKLRRDHLEFGRYLDFDRMVDAALDGAFSALIWTWKAESEKA